MTETLPARAASPSTGYVPPAPGGRAPREPRPPDAPRPRARSALVWRIFAAAAAVVCLLVATVVGTLEVFARRTADAAIARGLHDANNHVESLLDGRARALASAAEVFAQDSHIGSLLLNDSASADLLDQASEAARRTGATWVQFTDADGVRLAKSDEPSAPRVSLGATALVGGALDGQSTTGAGVAGDSVAIEGVAVPVSVGPDSARRIVGVLVAARALDSAVVRELHDATDGEVLIYHLDGAGRPRVSASSLPDAQRTAVLQRVSERRAAHDSVSGLALHLGGTTFVGQETPLRSAGGSVEGGVITLRSRDRELAPFLALRRRVLLAGLAGLLLTFGVAYLVARQITRPILALRDAARRVAAGDLSASAVGVGSTGEVAELADAVRSVLDQVQDRHALAEVVERARAVPHPETLGSGGGAVDGILAPGTVLARRYVIDKVLGVGGNGVVYRASDSELGETVAIKTLRQEAVVGGELALARLKEEIRLARRITHAGVVRIHDLGEADGAYFVTMEYVPGLSLQELLRRLGPLPAPVVVALGKQLCGALAAAHGQGIIHRDVKPPNLVVQPDGALKVLDFGVARLAERVSGLTQTGLVVGTPAYMAPEQLLDEHVDARADVWSVGVVLYEAVTGRLPYDAGTPAALIGRILTGDATAPIEILPSVPAPLSDAIARALARDPTQRLSSAAALHELLARAVRGEAQG
ncbi:protein kinase [Gemmatirosa kalamazoonensis]|uniref:non-specific serine/threonine protein kinase n=1 Tax=Gemmatirosa kalamazoonensis TaxID=861299 RepID=W0RMH7_9BACT|nr:serine/threonine-protein kinase [Gemmatirosa kalamazoonensis]AHG91976.1 protein kinase [Gemmatirosa kalamazoonensis]